MIQARARPPSHSNNFCKLEDLGHEDQDDILACVHFLLVDVCAARQLSERLVGVNGGERDMGFLSDIFNRAGRVARGQANDGMSAVEDATFDATVRQTVADMRDGVEQGRQRVRGGHEQL